MRIIKKLDDKMMTCGYDWFNKFEGKPHILSLIAIVWISSIIIGMRLFYNFFTLIFLACLGCFLLVHIYEWRAWYDLRKQNPHLPRFLEHNAAVYRKFLFWVSIILSIILPLFSRFYMNSFEIHNRFPMIEVEFARYGDYRLLILFEVIKNIAYGVIFIELIAIVFPKILPWTSKKYFLLLLIVSILGFLISMLGISYGRKTMGSIIL